MTTPPKKKFNLKESVNGCFSKVLKFIDNNSYIRNTLQFLHIRDTRDLNSEFRTIYANQIKPDDYEEQSELLDYGNNTIVTSKYTIWNFLPKNLFEQFRRIANIYFLINVILIFATPDPPTSPWTSMLPLLFVVIVTMIKQGYEDILRHKEDNKINNSTIRIFKNGKFEEMKWKQIKSGDIVEVMANQPIPCDLLLLHAKTEDNQCFITTANLDGETNLKTKLVMNGIKNIHSEDDLESFRAVVQFEKPNIKLYDFNGKLITNNSENPITNDNILLRGCNLRVAPLIYGLAIYVGKDTKIMRNSKFKSNKLSVIERRLNNFIICILLVLAVLTFTCMGLSFTSTNFYETHWYLDGREPENFLTNRALYTFIITVHFMTLFNYIVPLSLYVTIELQRFVGSQFIEWDLEMYDEKTDQPAKANTSDLNEDLGQVEYLFSDKTGTLTENEMIFKQFSIDGVTYEERDGKVFEIGSTTPVTFEQDPKIMQVLENLSLCHTVQLDKDNIYQAASPDEYSFIKFCALLGIVFKGDDTNKSTKEVTRRVDFKGKEKNFEILDILEFDSTRKRMSVIVRNMETNKIMLYTKGAESFVIKKCTSGDLNQCLTDIQRFAELGWRTLALAYKELSPSQYQEIKKLLNEAYNDFLDRNARISAAFESIESDLTLIGSTAVEDKLQEDVALTLETVRRAGIKVWVLTGDKKETAINISNSCKHFSKNMEHLIITDLKTRTEIERRLIDFRKKLPSDGKKSDKKRSFALTIDGGTLSLLFKENFEEPFRDICMQCDAVLCCRMSPAQKALVVRLVKSSESKPMTAAIGDGANDVSMIQEAHVGLGIFGKEGRNAAISADFAFAKFKYVKRILLVHGYLYYTRAANLVQYFFYKNLAFSICQFYYAFFNAFSTTSLYDSFVLNMYNVFYTSAPILLFGLCEQKVAINKLESNPYLYTTIKNNRLLTWWEFIRWNIQALWHSLVAFFFAYGIYVSNTALSSDGKIQGGVQFGGLVITLIIILVHVKLLTEWQYKSYFLVIGYLMSLLGYIVFVLVPNSFILPVFLASLLDTQSWTYWIYWELFSHLSVWFNIALVIVTAMLPDIVILIIYKIREDKKVTKAKERELELLETVNKNVLNYNQNKPQRNNTHLSQHSSFRPHSRLYDRSPKSMESPLSVYEFTPPKRSMSRSNRVYQTNKSGEKI